MNERTLTICAECKHVCTGCSRGTWCSSGWRCHHPDNERPLTIDPVTGDGAYLEVDQFDDERYTNDRYPRSREINTHAACEHYEEAEQEPAKKEATT